MSKSWGEEQHANLRDDKIVGEENLPEPRTPEFYIPRDDADRAFNGDNWVYCTDPCPGVWHPVGAHVS